MNDIDIGHSVSVYVLNDGPLSSLNCNYQYKYMIPDISNLIISKEEAMKLAQEELSRQYPDNINKINIHPCFLTEMAAEEYGWYFVYESIDDNQLRGTFFVRATDGAIL